MKIFFVGDTKSQFIKMDANMLEATGNEVTIIPHPVGTKRYPSFLLDLLCNKIKNYDLVWVWFADIHAIPIILLAHHYNKPVVVFCGDYEFGNYPEISYGNQRSFIRGYPTRWVLKNADEIITSSPITSVIATKVGLGVKLIDGSFVLPSEEEYYETHTMAHISTLPWYVDTTEFSGPTIKKENMVSTACASKNACARKGMGTFIEAAHGHCDTYILGNVERSEYIHILKQSQVYCQLTYPGAESFGVSLLEAMYCGCVPVTTNDPCLIWVAGNTGLVVPYGDVLATREAIEKAMTMDGEPARRRAMEFTREKRMASLNEILWWYRK
jgi:glycosyltransferase involved in cell wall biosynthesis